MNTAKKMLSLLVFFPLLLITQPGLAADGPVWVTASQVQVRPGMELRYEELVKTVIRAHNQQETDVYWFASMSQFGEGGQYTFARMHRSMATMQAKPDMVLTQALGESRVQELRRGIAETVKSVHNGAWQRRDDISVRPPENFNAVNLSIFTVKIKPGKNGVYEDYMVKSAEASRAQAPEAYYTAYSPSWGARNEYIFVAPLPDLGQLGPSPMPVPDRILAKFGKREGTKLLEMRESAVAEQWMRLNVSRPDLSRLPTADMAGR